MNGFVLGVVVATGIVAFANGANDNFKGVATFYGSGRASYGKALTWATVTTLAGALLALVLGAALAAKFTGRGLVPDGLATTPGFALAVAGAAAATVLLATRFGFPISTTHALLGALLGAGCATAPAAVKFGALGKSFVLPLLLSPIASLLLTTLVYRGAARLRRRRCIEVESGVGVAGLTVRQALDAGHFLSAGAVGFARGLNDAPKILALGATVPALPRELALLLVAGATWFALPVSTTHVSVGALFGIGAASGDARRKAIVAIVLAWCVTLPVAFVLALAAARLLR